VLATRCTPPATREGFATFQRWPDAPAAPAVCFGSITREGATARVLVEWNWGGSGQISEVTLREIGGGAAPLWQVVTETVLRSWVA
jgi:hypothetical protein